MNKTSYGRGVLYALLAYIMWGVLPLYWRLLSAVPPLHILAFRILFSLFFVSGILFAQRNFAWLNFFKNRREAFLLVLAALMVSLNWGLYIWAVNTGHTIEAALGYYINPIISVLLGLFFFKERMNILQVTAFSLAAIGVLILAILSGAFPWISLGLAFSFGFYGLVKKLINRPSLESLGAETLIASPLGLVLIFVTSGHGWLPELPAHILILLLLCGIVTALPLYLFGKSVKLIPLSTVGFIQFANPTLTFLTGIFIFKEEFPPHNFIVFGLIWTAVILYIVSLFKDRT